MFLWDDEKISTLHLSAIFVHFAYSDGASYGDIWGTYLALDDGGCTVMLNGGLSGVDSNSARYVWRIANVLMAICGASCCCDARFVLTCLHWEVVEATVCSCALFKVSLHRSDGSCSKRECIIQMGGRWDEKGSWNGLVVAHFSRRSSHERHVLTH